MYFIKYFVNFYSLLKKLSNHRTFAMESKFGLDEWFEALATVPSPADHPRERACG